MSKLINITTNEEGKQLVSARDLYLGLGLNKTQWSRWYPKNIEQNEYFAENTDFVGVRHNVEGNEVQDFAISLDFAKHIAMMARTEKSHEYRNYFLECESKLKEQQNMIGIKLSPMEILEIQFKALKDQEKKIDGVSKKIDYLEDNMPLFNVECKELQALVRKIGIKALGGYKTPAYKDSSLRCRIYQDIQQQLKREFGVTRYEAIKRCQLSKATEIVNSYTIPFILQEVVAEENNQIRFGEV